MKKLAESNLGIVILSFGPAVGFYAGLIKIPMNKIMEHMTTNWELYAAIALWVILLGFLYVRKEFNRIKHQRSEQIVFLIKYIDVLHKEGLERIKNTEFNEDNWRQSLLSGLNHHFSIVKYKDGVDGISNINREIYDSEQISHYKTKTVSDLQKEIDDLRSKLISTLSQPVKPN